VQQKVTPNHSASFETITLALAKKRKKMHEIHD
jgi:hypothetical protein